MARSALASAAVHVARLVPGVVEADADNDTALVRWLDVDEYRALGTGEQAAYDIARDLWLGDDALARFCLYADARYAEALLTALTIALAPVLVPLPPRTRDEQRERDYRAQLRHPLDGVA